VEEVRILAAGTGHSGTCLLSTVLVELKAARMSPGEDRRFFKYATLPENYGTKLGAIPEFGFTLKNVITAMDRYPDLVLLYSVRHPLDIFMSKIARGQKPSDGGDAGSGRDIVSADGTVEGAISVMRYFYDIYQKTRLAFLKRTLTVRMEDLVLSPKDEVRRIAKFLKVKPTQRAFEFYKYNYNKYHGKRYGMALDKSTVNLYTKWDSWHNGFFKDREVDIKKAERQLSEIIDSWGYGL